MNLIELERSLRQLRLGGIAAVLETRLHQAQAEARQDASPVLAGQSRQHHGFVPFRVAFSATSSASPSIAGGR